MHSSGLINFFPVIGIYILAANIKAVSPFLGFEN